MLWMHTAGLDNPGSLKEARLRHMSRRNGLYAGKCKEKCASDLGKSMCEILLV